MKDPIKVYDARWEVNEFNDSEVKRLFEATLGYARLLGVDTINIARDARLGCARVMELGIEVAINSGFRVFACFDPISTPLSYFMTMKTSVEFPDTMGLTVTASHNPSHYIGIKFTVPTVQAIGFDCGPMNGLTKIKELYHSDFKLEESGEGELIIINHPAEEYIKYSMNAANVKKDSLSGLTLVLDAFNGSAGPELYRALTLAGAKVIPQRIVPNGHFPTGSPNPTSQNKMDPVIEKAQKSGADVVIGVDGDGDRIVFGDKYGLFSAGFVMIPILKTILASLKGGVKYKALYDPKVNPLALEKWGELSVEPVLFRNGHSQIKDYMREIDSIAGAEESGHFYHKLELEDMAVWGENSLMTILLFLDAVKKNPELLHELRKMQEQVFTSGEFNYVFPSDEVRDQAMEAVIQSFKKDNAQISTETSDGIDLGGSVVYKGVKSDNGIVTLEKEWYSAYIRIATNEKGVVRSYISSGENDFGQHIENELRKILEEEFNGEIIE